MFKAVIFDMYETLITHFDAPLYFGRQIAEDAGIAEEDFQKMWKPTDEDRTVGKLKFEDVIRDILTANGRYSDDLFSYIVNKRISCKEDTFNHLHPDILSMLELLKKNGIKTAVISNCFSEECGPIKNSIIAPYIDEMCLSYEEGIKKPNPEIFFRCAKKLGLSTYECLYVGDGGSEELEAARAVGMRPVQACWYLKADSGQPVGRKTEFTGAFSPLEIVNIAKNRMHLCDYIGKYYFDRNYNCAESLLLAANEFYSLGLSPIDIKLVGAFGGGLQTGNTCGAVLSAVEVLSLKYIKTKAHESDFIGDVAGEFIARVESSLESTRCEIIKPKLALPEKRCIKTVNIVADILEDTIKEFDLKFAEIKA